MQQFFYLATCTTCKRIQQELALPETVVLQDIKKEPLTLEDVELLKKLAGSYEALFSKRAQLYKQRDLKNQNLQESDYKALLLEHYTFLKRPVLVLEDTIFIGNAKNTVEEAKKALHN